MSFIDFHCHPSMKPYGRSFSSQIGRNSEDPQHVNSSWHYDAPNLFDRGLQLLCGISKFTQADFTTLAFGDVRIIFASLYPVERDFFRNKLGQAVVSDLVNDFITGVGKPRVDNIQNQNNYFQDLELEYDFYKQLNNVPVTTYSGDFKYVIASSYSQIQRCRDTDPLRDNIIFVVPTIEGLHSLNENLSEEPHEEQFLANLLKVKTWEFAPAFVTFSHHFYNHLCGHAKSLTGIVGKATDQRDGMNTGFTALGKSVLRELLSESNGRRIPIDIKHMSPQGRKEYFQILKSDYAGQDIPIIVSHGAANGMKSMDDPTIESPTGMKFLHEDINFYDDEILEIARTKGIFALQLDERRIANTQTLKAVKHSLFMNKIRHYRAELVWFQIQYIAELLDKNNLPAWDAIAIGSDYEGIINPLNGYLTAETMAHLEEYTERHAHNYLQSAGKNLKPLNQINADEIVNRVFHTNGLDFLRKFY